MRKVRDIIKAGSAKTLSAAMSVVLAMGLAPLPAYAAPNDLVAVDFNTQAAAATDGYVIGAAYAAAEPSPEILGLNNPSYRNLGEADNMATIFALDENEGPDPYLLNYLAGETPGVYVDVRQGGGPTAGPVGYWASNATDSSRAIWNLQPDVIIGTGSSVAPANEYTYYDNDDCARAVEQANNLPANSYHPIGVTYDMTDLNTMINTMYKIAIGADSVVAQSNGAKKLRYNESALTIAKEFEEYVTGLKGYTLEKITEGEIPLRSIANVVGYDAESNTFKIIPGSTQEGTASGNRLLEAAQGVSKNYYDSATGAATTTGEGRNAITYKTVSADELSANADLILTGGQNMLSTLDEAKAGFEKNNLLDKAYWHGGTTGNGTGSVFGVTMNAVENAQNVGRIVPMLYPEILDQSDFVAYYYDHFYHIKSGSLGSVIDNMMDGVRNAKATDSTSLELWSASDVADYNSADTQAILQEGMGYMLSLDEGDYDAIMTPTKYYTQDESDLTTKVDITTDVSDASGASATLNQNDANQIVRDYADEGAESVKVTIAALGEDDLSSAGQAAWQSFVDEDTDMIYAYDVTVSVLDDTGREIDTVSENSINLSVTLPLDKAWNGRTASIKQIHNGEIQKPVTATVSGGAVSFSVSKLSEFVVGIPGYTFDVYTIDYAGNTKLAKEYTKADFQKLANTNGAPVSGLYWKNDVWNVSTAVSYVTLSDLFKDAGVKWDTTASIQYGGDPSQGKASNTFTYDTISQLKFYPNTTTTGTDTSGAVDTGAVLGLTTSNSGVAIGSDSDNNTAAKVQANAATDNTTTCAPYMIMGSLEKDYTSKSGTTVAGKRLWTNNDSIYVSYSCDVVYRLNNLVNGEHMYTTDYNEYQIQSAKDTFEGEGVAWYAPEAVKSNGTKVYRLYNSVTTKHVYSSDPNEYNTLVNKGWKIEGVVYCSDPSKSVEIHRLYNADSALHHYTGDPNEIKGLTSGGKWKDEGTFCYALQLAS